ncbi:hypothetical protein EIO64_11155 [Dysosmobacter welbionis]|jgi:hypothetical protein|uniref:Uncharacterized protein n=1 Tax=Dysosmobacter welbionis TaxID=2093857 RepID=A0A4D7AQ10_9FIRM|nr:hypothetical protein [Dysosmobacter welbionis]QCI59705.1 hypothetical protein EIO64_11155 [Dysosmobacter welbionis]
MAFIFFAITQHAAEKRKTSMPLFHTQNNALSKPATARSVGSCDRPGVEKASGLSSVCRVTALSLSTVL